MRPNVRPLTEDEAELVLHLLSEDFAGVAALRDPVHAL